MFNWNAVAIATLTVLGVGLAAGIMFGSLLLLKALLGPGWESTAAYFGGWGLIGVIAMGFWVKPKQESEPTP